MRYGSAVAIFEDKPEAFETLCGCDAVCADAQTSGLVPWRIANDPGDHRERLATPGRAALVLVRWIAPDRPSGVVSTQRFNLCA
jgi:hypothetical protein